MICKRYQLGFCNSEGLLNTVAQTKAIKPDRQLIRPGAIICLKVSVTLLGFATQKIAALWKRL